MTEIVVTGDYAGNWLDTIIDFNFPSQHVFAALTFQAITHNNPPTIPTTTPSFPLTVPQVAWSSDIFSFNPAPSPLVRSTKPYHKADTVITPVPDTTTWVYSVLDTFNDPPFQIGAQSLPTVTVVSDGTNVFWSAGATGGAGDISAFLVWDAAAIVDGGATVVSQVATLLSGPTVTQHPPSSNTTNTDNAVYLFDLTAIKKQVGPKVPKININLATPPLGGTGYQWSSVLTTYKSAKWASFPVTPTNTPSGWPPKPITTITKNRTNTGVLSYLLTL